MNKKDLKQIVSLQDDIIGISERQIELYRALCINNEKQKKINILNKKLITLYSKSIIIKTPKFVSDILSDEEVDVVIKMTNDLHDKLMENNSVTNIPLDGDGIDEVVWYIYGELNRLNGNYSSKANTQIKGVRND